MDEHSTPDSSRGLSHDRETTAFDRDVVVVGGGPAGSSAAVFTSRYGLDTLVFDRGNAALRRCAYLENYLGFPAGVDVETFHELMAAHVEEAGCDLVPEMVTSVERLDRDGGNAEPDRQSGFAVETQEGRRVTTAYVVAAAWYDGSYLRALGDEAMFETREHHGETEERFDPEYPDDDGRTRVDGLYVASPAGERSEQAIVAAGNGAHVARCLLADHRRDLGYPEGVVAKHYDWLRPDSEFSGEWADRDRWREWFENEAGDHDLDDARFERLRERHLDRAFATRLTDAEVEELEDRGLRRLVEVVGPERVLDAIGDERVLDTLDDSAIREYARGEVESSHE